MPIGVLTNVAAVALGGIFGGLASGHLSKELCKRLDLVFGLSAMGLGIMSIVLMQNMPAVILALILGTLLGTVIHVDDLCRRGGAAMQRCISRMLPGSAAVRDESLLVTAIVLFCASGTGIYGSIVSGMSGDHSILIAKAILDLFTALIFACSLGPVTALIAVPQLIVFLLLYFSAGLLYPLTTPTMIDDFKACGGLIMLATGFRIAGIRDFPIADMIPAMVLVWPISLAWTAWVLPLLH